MMENDIIIETPFFSQKIDEDNFEKDGFINLEQALHWQERGCGIVSLRMVITALNPNANLPNYKDLIDEGIGIGAYCSKGWIHQGLLSLGKKYNINGTCYRNKSYLDIANSIKKGELCICSVSVCFNQHKKGGHLIVVNGIKEKDNKIIGFFVNHPSSVSEYNFKNKFISAEELHNSFSGNYISFYSVKKNRINEQIKNILTTDRIKE